MCRVIAPITAMSSREAASRSSFLPRPTIHLLRRLRIARHRALRWFEEPISVVARRRRLDDVLWQPVKNVA